VVVCDGGGGMWWWWCGGGGGVWGWNVVECGGVRRSNDVSHH
jgi:hypothetical protein